jgi:MFS family permease
VIWSVYYAFGVFFKPVLTEFGWTRAMTSGAFSLSAIVHGLLGFVIGGLTDKFGPRLVITFCGLLLGLGYLLMSQISAVWQFYLFYGVIIGAGMGGSFIPFMTTVARWFSKRRGAMSGIVAAGTGALIGPPVASRLIVTHGWRVSYALLGCMVLAVTVIAAQFMKRDPAKVGQVIDGGNQGEKRGLYSGDEGLSLREAVYTSKFWAFFTTGFCLDIACLLSWYIVHLMPLRWELQPRGLPTF